MTETLQPPAETNWAEAVRRLARASLLVVGDLLLDRYVFGDVARVSPEAPVPVLTVAREVALPGGAGNVVRNLTAIGAAVAFVSIVGDDQNGSDLTGLIGGQPGVEPWILVQGGRLTTVKSRFIAQGQQLFRADKDDPSPIHAKLAERMIRIAHDAMAATDITVLTDYGQGVLAGDVAPQLIRAVKSLGRRVVVDPGTAAAGLARFAGADVLVPGRRLLADLTGETAPTDETLIQAAAALRAEHGFGAVLVFGAKDGLLLVNDAGAAHFPTEAAEYYDVLGARDAVLGTLAAALGIGHALPVAARLAALAAGGGIGK
ncbi:bifunctional heptose 7-phosphate kinase/heptose 1-phosphate adenyltransferase, partial [Acidisphaera rubrifaciens]|uniref:bifunctional heptose 7-phosphate kinase/heptose 1-phosphate adenyltransferase n=1 Tax=Acidisphaera rubrifaciens TaxID=50715 RepID=UPI0006624426